MISQKAVGLQKTEYDDDDDDDDDDDENCVIVVYTAICQRSYSHAELAYANADFLALFKCSDDIHQFCLI